MRVMLSDLRFALRTAFRRPGYVAAVCGTLALGVAAVTSVFAFVNSILLTPLHYPKPDELVQICQYDHRSRKESVLVSIPDVMDWKTRAKSFADLAYFETGGLVLTGAGTPEPVMGIRVSDDYFSALQIEPFAGRWFTADEFKSGPDTACIISHQLWRRRFDSNPQIIGKTLLLNGNGVTVVGVMPPAFRFPDNSQVALTSGFINWEKWHRDMRVLRAIGRLKPDVSITAAQSELDGIAQSLAEQFPQSNAKLGVRIVRLKDQIIGDASSALKILFGAVCCVLIIACANIASLLLVRAVDRRKEFAIRIALGADRIRIAKQQLTESLLLAVLGGLLSLFLSVWCVNGLVALSPVRLPRLDDVHVDSTALLFCMVIAVMCGAIFGLMPVAQTFRSNVVESLNEEGKAGSGSHRTSWMRGAILLFQVSITTALMIGAGLFIRSYVQAQHVEIGFNPDHVVISKIALRTWQYPSETERNRLFRPLLRNLEQLREKKTVALATWPPFTGQSIVTLGVEGIPKSPGERFSARENSVSQRYFETMGMRVTEGRNFASNEDERSPLVVIVNEALAKDYFGGLDPIGQRITVQGRGTNQYTVIGVVNNVRQASFTQESEPELYFNYFQLNDVTVHVVAKVEHSQDFNSFANKLRKELQLLDGRQAASEPKWFAGLLGSSLQIQRFRTYLLTFFASIAMVLSAVGIFGFISYAVGLRTREIGILLALGAPRTYIVGTVMKESVVIIGIGLVIGLVGAFVGGTFVESFLFGVKATDLLTFASVTLFVSIVAGVAAYLPILRASRLEVMAALQA